MKPELLQISNIKILNNNERISYNIYDGHEIIKIYELMTFKNIFNDWNSIYNKIILDIIEYGKINKSISNINEILELRLDILKDKIDEIFSYLSMNNYFNGTKFIIINDEIFNIIKDLLNNQYIDVNYVINNDIGNNIIFGIKNNIDEEGINIYLNKQRKYICVNQGQNIHKYYFTLNYDII